MAPPIDPDWPVPQAVGSPGISEAGSHADQPRKRQTIQVPGSRWHGQAMRMPGWFADQNDPSFKSLWCCSWSSRCGSFVSSRQLNGQSSFSTRRMSQFC